MSAGFAITFAPEGIPEGLRIEHTSGWYGTEGIRGNNIRCCRARLGMSPAQLAASVGIRTEYLKKIELGGGRPRKETIKRIAKALKCTIGELEER